MWQTNTDYILMSNTISSANTKQYYNKNKHTMQYEVPKIHNVQHHNNTYNNINAKDTIDQIPQMASSAVLEEILEGRCPHPSLMITKTTIETVWLGTLWEWVA